MIVYKRKNVNYFILDSLFYFYHVLKTTLIKCISTLLITLVLISSFDWSVNAHFCGSALINYSLFGEAEGCGMQESEIICSTSDGKEAINKFCCSNKDLIFENVDFFKNLDEIQKNQKAMAWLFSNTTANSSRVPTYFSIIEEDPPPIICLNFHSLFQIFLI